MWPLLYLVCTILRGTGWPCVNLRSKTGLSFITFPHFMWLEGEKSWNWKKQVTEEKIKATDSIRKGLFAVVCQAILSVAPSPSLLMWRICFSAQSLSPTTCLPVGQHMPTLLSQTLTVKELNFPFQEETPCIAVKPLRGQSGLCLACSKTHFFHACFKL